MTDHQILLELKDLDESDDAELSSWECDFLESIIKKIEDGDLRLTSRQRECALKILAERS